MGGPGALIVAWPFAAAVVGVFYAFGQPPVDESGLSVAILWGVVAALLLMCMVSRTSGGNCFREQRAPKHLLPQRTYPAFDPSYVTRRSEAA